MTDPHEATRSALLQPVEEVDPLVESLMLRLMDEYQDSAEHAQEVVEDVLLPVIRGYRT